MDSLIIEPCYFKYSFSKWPKTLHHTNIYEMSEYKCKEECAFGVRLHTVINPADFRSWCMLYTYEGNKMQSSENDAILLRVNH